MTNKPPAVTTKVATLALPTRESHVAASVWPGPRGMLLFLAELNLAPQTRQEFLQKITAAIEHSWQEAKLMTGPADEILETILLAVNQPLVGSERLLGNPLSPRYQLMLAHLSGRQLAFSNLGRIDAFVISSHKLANVLLTTAGRRGTNKNTTFDNIITGELMPGETLLLATSALTDYFSWDKLKQMIIARPPGQTLREIEKYMLQLKAHPPLGLISLKLSLASEYETTVSSLNRFLKTKAQTDSLLQPKLLNYLKNKLSWPRHKTTDQLEAAKTNIINPSPAINTARPDKARAGLSLVFSKIWRVIKSLAWLTNRESAKSTLAWQFEAKLAYWRRLPKFKQAIFLLGIILLLAFSQSIVNLGKKNIKVADSEQYNQLVVKITEKQAAIEGVLIYGDHDKATSLYNDVAMMIADLPRNSPSRQEQWQALNQTLVLLNRRLQYLNEITEPQAWAQLPGAATGQVWQVMALVNNQLLVASTNQLFLFTADGKVNTTIDLPSSFGKANQAVAGQNELLLLSDSGQSATFNLSNNRLTPLERTPEIKDASFYQNGLYYLSQNNRTIWRTSRSGTSFASPALWLRNSQGQLVEAVSLTVDGAIFVATAQNVEKYSRGLKQEFSLAQVNPPLTSIDRIYTTNDKDFLYLWEIINKRLVVYDKSGKLIVQVTLPTLPAITAMAVDGVNKILYVMSGHTVYRVPILAPVK